MTQVGAELGCSAPTVAKYLRSIGEPIRAVGKLPGQQEPTVAELQALRDQGLSAVEIGERYGHGGEWARRWLVRHGIDRLPGKARPDRNAFWGGGRTVDKDGYVLCHFPSHPRATRGGYVREHRLVMEAELGRLLDADEVVDHRNGIVDDNRPSNLRVFPANSDHLRSTLTGRHGPGGTRSRRSARFGPGGPTPSASETGAEPSRSRHPLGPWPHGTSEPGPSGSPGSLGLA